MPSMIISERFPGQDSQRRRITLGTNETTPWYPTNGSGSVAVKPTSGTIRAELTSSPLSIVRAVNDNDSSKGQPIAVVWPAGDSSTTTQLEYSFTTAIRFVSVGVGGIAEIAD